LFLYGVVFPIIYGVLKPILVYSLGEIFYQKHQAAVYGESKMRMKQPIYFSLAVVMLFLGVWRVMVPLGKEAFSMEVLKASIERYDKVERKAMVENEKRRISLGEEHEVLIEFTGEGEHCLYKWPRHGSECIGKIPSGVSKVAQRKYGRWYRVTYWGKTGWVFI